MDYSTSNNNSINSINGAGVSAANMAVGGSHVIGHVDTTYNVSDYPEFMRSLPFCCWKMEAKKGKVPYDPKVEGKATKRAKVNEPETFGTLDEALEAYSNNRAYNGIGLKVSEPLGAIDLDKCVRDDPAFSDYKNPKAVTLDDLSENAKQVLKMLPDAVVELSPSKLGLHLFFSVPEGFAFDRDEYYINNRKIGMEIYFADTTNRFLTVTGDRINTAQLFAAELATSQNDGADKAVADSTGDGADGAESAGYGHGRVTAEALTQFLDSFMKRPEAKLAEVHLPEGGSILTDEEVISKAKSGKNGERFRSLYEGDWIRLGESDINWSQSEADIALCGILAFYCRGDLNQMDRLFRGSGLMRDKWDRPQSNSSYGVITMTNAVANCLSFYNPQHEWEEQVEHFKALIDSFIKHNEGGSNAVVTNKDGGTKDNGNEECIDSDRLFDEDALLAAAWAMRYDIKRWSKLRKLAQKMTSISLYEKHVKATMTKLPHIQREICTEVGEPLILFGVDCQGFRIPKNWRVNERGISFIDEKNGVDDHFSPQPVFVSSSQISVDENIEKMGITFKRKGQYKTIIVPRSDMLVSRKIVGYGDTGLPVTEKNAAMMASYISDFESVNDELLILKRYINRAGWIKDEFFPYYVKSEILPIDDEDHTLANIKAEGNRELWMALAEEVRKLPFARAMMAASFASPLIEKLKQRIIYYHSWGSSKSGKTATMLFALSIWGNPQALMKTYTSTIVGMEHRAGMMRHLPLALDEIQSIDKKINLGQLVYELGNGYGKVRGKPGGSTKATDVWKNCILSTGEQPISNRRTMDGVNTRILEVNAEPINDPKIAKAIHKITQDNYGFAGPVYIRFLIDEVLHVSPEPTAPLAKPISSTAMAEATAPTVFAVSGAVASAANTVNTIEVGDGAGDGAGDSNDIGKQDSDDSGARLPRWMLIAEELEQNDAAIRLVRDFRMICSAIAILYDETEPQFDNIAVLALADYYASISVFGLSEEQALSEAVSLAGALLENQMEIERIDFVDRAWDFTRGWIARNKHKFESSVISPTETYGMIEGDDFLVIASILNAALEEAGFTDSKSIKGFADRGYITVTKDKEGKNRTQIVRRINGVSNRVYKLNLKDAESSSSQDVDETADECADNGAGETLGAFGEN